MDGSILSSRRETVCYITELLFYILNQLYRLEIQAKVRQMGDNPSGTDRQTVETACERLTVLLQELKNAMQVAGVVEVHGPLQSHDSLVLWDDIVNETVPTGDISMPVIEHRPAHPNSSQSSSTSTQIED